jgi:hypothetical protein
LGLFLRIEPYSRQNYENKKLKDNKIMVTGNIAGKITSIATTDGMSIGKIQAEKCELLFATNLEGMKKGTAGVFSGSMEPIDGSLVFRVNSLG